MLRDSVRQLAKPASTELSVSPEVEVNSIFNFVDKHLPEFPAYYQSIKDSTRENRISDFLVHHFQLCKTEDGGYFPFDFRKNPTQATSGKETDIGVFLLFREKKPLPIVEFEAKRFSSTSNNKEYVCGERGGIERFKRGYHSSHLSVCGMFAYTQATNDRGWVNDVNTWIRELSVNSTDNTIDWANVGESLVTISTVGKIEKLSSEHSRKQVGKSILLYHYFIDLN